MDTMTLEAVESDELWSKANRAQLHLALDGEWGYDLVEFVATAWDREHRA
jgi:hypothetical protein